MCRLHVEINNENIKHKGLGWKNEQHVQGL